MKVWDTTVESVLFLSHTLRHLHLEMGRSANSISLTTVEKMSLQGSCCTSNSLPAAGKGLPRVNAKLVENSVGKKTLRCKIIEYTNTVWDLSVPIDTLQTFANFI